MKRDILPQLACPKLKSSKACGGQLDLDPVKSLQKNSSSEDVVFGRLICKKCQKVFPILGGVAILVSDVNDYLLGHAKGILQVVKLHEVSHEFRQVLENADFNDVGAFETDVESTRVVSLYALNHYGSREQVCKSINQKSFQKLVKDHWNLGPMNEAAKLVSKKQTVLELGCSVGGLASRIDVKSYLGLDLSFLSVALGRHLLCGAEFSQKTQFYTDLLGSPQLLQTGERSQKKHAELIVGDLQNPPVHQGWDVCISLNTIDMLDRPERLAQIQFGLLKKGGVAIQSSPYIWPPQVRERLKKFKSSILAAKTLYQEAGFEIDQSQDDISWIFFKHQRQLEIYSVHLLSALKRHG